MGTDNRRVATYLPKEIDDRLKAFILERNLKGDSPALIVILSEYFGVSQQVAQLVDYSSFATQNQLETLSSRVNSISEKLSELSGKLLGKPLQEAKTVNEHVDAVQPVQPVPVDVDASLTSEILSELPTNIDLDDNATSELRGDSLVEHLILHSTKDIKFSASQLSKRLVIGPSTISVRKNDSPEKFAEWSCGKDPDNVAWSFSTELNRFQPIGDLSVELQSKLLSEIPSELSNTLTNGELAKRLGIDGSTLSHWKSGKKGRSPDELLRATRERDPDGIGWILIPETNRFSPERNLQNKQPDPFQGELLSELNSVIPDS